MNLNEVLSELEAKGSAATKNIFLKHGAKEPFWGVKVGDMKPLVKFVKKDQDLAKKLYDTGISDAMYLAGLCTDGSKMTKDELNQWVKKAGWYMISEYSVPWVAAENEHSFELGLEWIDSDEEHIASSGWSLLAGLAMLKQDDEIDFDLYRKLLKRVESDIHHSKNRVRYAMNNFIISTGTCLKELTQEALDTARKVGKVEVNLGETACKVPLADQYIAKVIDSGRLGYKKKTLKC